MATQTMLYRIPVYQVKLVKERNLKVSQEKVVSPSIAAEVIRSYIGPTDREHFVVLMLDTKTHIIGVNTVSVGTLNASLVHPRETFKPAILVNAFSIILGHNHPSGDPLPSPEDIANTRLLVQAGKLLDIEVQDHVIVTSDGAFYSLKRYGDF